MASKKTNARAHVVERVRVDIILPESLASPEGRARLCAALTVSVFTSPTHWGTDERTKLRFSGELPGSGEFMLWRSTRPKFIGGAPVSVRNFSRLHLEFDEPPELDMAPMWLALSQLVETLQPVFAGMHLSLSTKDQKVRSATWNGFGPRLFEYFDVGPAGAFACTWFGPDLVSRIGERLLTTAGASMRRDGSARLMLHEHPWTLTAPELLSLQAKANEVLRTSGMLADYTAFPPRPGPKWVPIPRKIP